MENEGAPAGAERDFIDRLRADWGSVLPRVDTEPLEVLGRIGRIGAQANRVLDRGLEQAGVSRSEFDVLCALARAERPLRASEVTAQTMLSGAATTKLTARLEAAGLVQRERLERDARVVLLRLTPAGKRLVGREFPRGLEADERVLSVLSAEERAQLAALLRRVGASVERAASLG